jgi:HEPN domain-containing protein
MSVEQSAKAVLLALGIDFPREHDVSPLLLRLRKRTGIPGWFRDELESMARTVSELAEQRALAGYGFEKGVDLETFRQLAPKALAQAKKIHSLCKRLLDTLGPEHG